MTLHPWKLALMFLVAGLLALPGSVAAQPAAPAPATPAPHRPAGRAGWYSTRPSRTPASIPNEQPGAPATVAQDTWTNLFPELYAVSAISATDAWAAGEYGHLLHYDGGSWTATDPPLMHGHTLHDLAMLSPSSGWIGAWDHAYQYDGTNWIERSGGLGSGQLVVDRLAPLGPDDVWAAGSTGYTFHGAPNNTILHWDGNQWRVAGPVLNTVDGLGDLAMLNATTGWAVGWTYDLTNGDDVPLLLRWDGAAWTPVSTPIASGYFYHIRALAPDDLWISGGDTSGIGMIYRDHAGTWTTWTTPDTSDPFDLLPLSDTSVWASTGSGTILHWDGTTWTPEYHGHFTPGLASAGSTLLAVGLADTVLQRDAGGTWRQLRGGPTTGNLYDVSILGPDDAWAVGAPGTFAHYAGGKWFLMAAQNSLDLYRLLMVSDTDGYGVGPGTIQHWDGAQWTQVASPPVPMWGLAMTGPGEGWAVGNGGAIWHASGGTWAQVSSPTTVPLTGVAFDAPEHGWAVGGSCTPGCNTSFPDILEFTGGQWVERTPNLEGTVLYDLELAPGGAEGWAVGEVIGNGNAAVHLQNGTWSWGPGSGASGLLRVAGEALNEAWALSSFYTDNNAYHFAGGAWQAQPLPTDSLFDTSLLSLGLVPGRGGWAVGNGGKILRYNPLAPGQRFYDVPLANPFAPYIEYMAAHNIIGGYADNTFHPSAATTRGQLAKMIVNGIGLPLYAPPAPTFADVPASQPFYTFVETAHKYGRVSGYTCGGPGEPCDAQHHPYFRPAGAVTRAQLAKILVMAENWGPVQPPTPTFADVPASDPFYGYVEQAVTHGIIGGYACGGPGEPCPGRYFRPAAPATRGQISKILYLALTSGRGR